ALNEALGKVSNHFVISEEEHFAIFDGLPTIKKLEVLHKKKGLPTAFFEGINLHKQEVTRKMIRAGLKSNPQLQRTLSSLKSRQFKLAVASNSLRSTINLCLKKLQVSEIFDAVFSCEDVLKAKPDPEIYLACMKQIGTL